MFSLWYNGKDFCMTHNKYGTYVDRDYFVICDYGTKDYFETFVSYQAMIKYDHLPDVDEMIKIFWKFKTNNFNIVLEGSK